MQISSPCKIYISLVNSNQENTQTHTHTDVHLLTVLGLRLKPERVRLQDPSTLSHLLSLPYFHKGIYQPRFRKLPENQGDTSITPEFPCSRKPRLFFLQLRGADCISGGEKRQQLANRRNCPALSTDTRRAWVCANGKLWCCACLWSAWASGSPSEGAPDASPVKWLPGSQRCLFCTAAKEENETAAGEDALWIPDVPIKPVTDAAMLLLLCRSLLSSLCSAAPVSPPACLLHHYMGSHSAHPSLHQSGQQKPITHMRTLQAGPLYLLFQDCRPRSHWCLGLLNINEDNSATSLRDLVRTKWLARA